jgi:hypothetical protein
MSSQEVGGLFVLKPMTVSDPPYCGVPPVPGYVVVAVLVVVDVTGLVVVETTGLVVVDATELVVVETTGLVVVDATELVVVVDALLQEERAIAATNKILKPHINFLFMCVEFSSYIFSCNLSQLTSLNHVLPSFRCKFQFHFENKTRDLWVSE